MGSQRTRDNLMQIQFVVVKQLSDKPKNPKELLLPEDAPNEYLGIWNVRALTAKEGIDALDELIMKNDEYKENPDLITEAVFRKALVEKAVAKDGNLVASIKLDKIPNKLWQVLIAANQKLNGISDNEARFLLEPSASTKKQSIQP